MKTRRICYLWGQQPRKDS